ncbi:MAG: hypothetical protein AAFQ87_05160 [Bacteroidota bacterium]
MSQNIQRFSLKFRKHSPLILLILLSLSACRPEGFINKVKYQGTKYINTCETFNTTVSELIQRNNNPGALKVSEYDNSDFTYYYLEQGQFEILRDTLRFRLVSDLPYTQYLDKGVAVHVNASYSAPPSISNLSPSPDGTIGTLVVDRAYYLANRKPFFLYKIPLNGAQLAGKQLMLSFAIAKYNSDGSLKDYYCETQAKPIGVIQPACCTAQAWDGTELKSIVDFPEIQVADESFVYQGFTGTIDVQFKENSFDVYDDSSFTALTIQTFVNKYRSLGYKVQRIDLFGYASPGGKEDLNMKLSQKRADALKNSLEILNGEVSDLEINAKGMGEDWERVKALTQISSLSQDQKDQVAAIANDESLTNDQKEARLRRVKFWDTLVEEVLIKARHTFAIMDFVYDGDLPTLERFAQQLPVASRDLDDVANTRFAVSAYKEDVDVEKAMANINEILTQKATPNLYAMRATYRIAEEKYDEAVEDLEKAGRFRGPNQQDYVAASQGLKIFFADNYDFARRKALYDEYNKMAVDKPGDRQLFFNRAILMDKLGLISPALNEYKNLLDGHNPTPEQLNNRGVARLKGMLVNEAEADFMSALETNPDMAEVYYNLATISALKGLTRKTVEMLDKAIELDSTYKALIFNNPVFRIMSEDPRFDKYR